MNRTTCSFLLILTMLAACGTDDGHDTLAVSGLDDEVEIIRDQWGVNHIYARNERDLFFAQGYAAARDRLFQFEVWRRQSAGTVAEILGERELKRDWGTRLFRYRGDMDTELNHYHPRGKEIITSFTEGVNAYIAEALKDTAALPIEFKMLGILPKPWTPDIVISRHQGLLGNIGSELSHGRAVAILGEERVKELSHYEPWEPDLSLDEDIPKELLFEDILELYNAYRRPVWFQPGDVLPQYRASGEGVAMEEALNELNDVEALENAIGSNNWIISGERSYSGFPLLANDPHRTQAVPSLRYIVHLNAPGWNVIGGGEPEIPGVSIGHNDHGAWGLTVFRTDGEDLLVYRTDPDDPDRYYFNGAWIDMEVEEDRIPVKGREPVEVRYRYTLHGPVVFQKDNYAFAVRCAWMEPGGSPYLASLRMDQAENWEQFREACSYSNIPGENMIWADRQGTIGWQSVGIAPVRENYSGLVPVPGDGRYDWKGYLPIIEKPNLSDPEKGYFATANENVIPPDYPNNGAISYEWTAPFRGQRIEMVLSEDEEITMEDMKILQTDYFSVPASKLVPLLREVEMAGKAELARASLLDWDLFLEKNSIAASIYVTWERNLRRGVIERNIPADAMSHISVSMVKVVQWLEDNETEYIGDRDELLSTAMNDAVDQLTEKLGENMDAWQYGQEKFRHALLRHPLRQAVSEEWRNKLDVGPAPRAGYSYTVGAGGGLDNQTSGASFRLLVNTGNWDETLAMNNPGQSGDPDSRFYSNLFQDWANDGFFPLFFSRAKIDSVSSGKRVLVPNHE